MPRSKVLELVIVQPCDLNDARNRFAARSGLLGYVLEGEIVALWQANLFDPPDAIVRCRAKKGKYFPQTSEGESHANVPCEGQTGCESAGRVLQAGASHETF